MAAIVAPDAEARTGARVRIAVAEQPLGDALVDFAIQTNVSISTVRGGFGVLRAPEVRGIFTPEVGLRRLLAHTNLTVEKIDAVTFRIVEGHIDSAERPRAIEGVGVDEIVVTAARRPRTLDRFAASATVLDSDALTQLGAESSTDLAEGIAGLSFTNLGPGRNKIVVRSLSDGAFSGRTESTIGIYVEDSRITYGAPDPDLKLVDVDRVEILRGPQGVLYGGGSIGGIYRITMNSPDLADPGGVASAAGETTRDGGIGQNFEGMVNIPIVSDRLGVRLVGYRESTAGWLDNDTLGLKDTNRTIREGLRATVLARLDGSWTVNVRALTQGTDSFDSQYTSALVDERRRSTQMLEPHDNDFSLVNATLRGGTSVGEFSATTTALHHVYNSRSDATGAFAGFGVDAASVAAFDDENDLKFIIEEARLTGVASPFPWTLGVFASFGELSSVTRLTPDLQGASPEVFYEGRRIDDIREYAVYGEAEWPVTRRIDLSLGLRAFHTEVSTRAAFLSVSASLTDQFAGNRSHTGVAPQVRISYEPGPDAFYYLQAGNGYRSGGFNAGASAALAQFSGDGPAQQPLRQFDTDELWSYEAGFKHAYFDERLRVRAAAFVQVWTNVQTDQLIASNLSFTGNVGDVANRGGEIEAAIRWSDNLATSAHLTFTDSEVVRANASFPVSAEAGLPGTPPFIGGGAIDYRRRVPSVGTLSIHAGVIFVGKSGFTFSDQTNVTIGGYVDSNVRIAIETDKWRTTLYVENAADADARTFSYGNIFRFGDTDLITPLRPRTIGLEIARRF